MSEDNRIERASWLWKMAQDGDHADMEKAMSALAGVADDLFAAVDERDEMRGNQLVSLETMESWKSKVSAIESERDALKTQVKELQISLAYHRRDYK